MKWLSIALEIAVIIYNHVTGKGKRDLGQELEICQSVLGVLTTHMTPEEKGRTIQEAVGNLKAVKKFNTRVSGKIDKARDRLARKFL